MHINEHVLFSTNLSKNMNLRIYGHYGFALLLFPATTDSSLECEENGLIDAISPYMGKGKFKVFATDSANFDCWLNEESSPEEKSQKHFDFNNYILEEVVPFIFAECGGPVPIITCGAAIGAYHAANTYFRRPDIFYGVIAMSGTFNIEHFTNGFFDSNCYFNSPIHYLPNLNDNYWLSFLKSKHHVYIMSGSGEGEFPENAVHLGEVLDMKEIPHSVNIWGNEFGHDWDTWNKMLPYIMETKL